jgi:hypothetical protein
MVPKKAKKKRGPAPTGKGTQIGARWQPPVLAAIDAWRIAQEDQPERGEAIRRLVERGLAAAQIDAQVEANRAAAPKGGRGK